MFERIGLYALYGIAAYIALPYIKPILTWTLSTAIAAGKSVYDETSSVITEAYNEANPPEHPSPIIRP